MPSYTKIIDGLTDLGMHKMQEYIDHYIDAVNNGDKSFSDALEELISIEKENNKIRAINACVKVANFPFIKTMDDFDFSFQPGINKKELLEFTSLGFIERKEVDKMTIFVFGFVILFLASEALSFMSYEHEKKFREEN